MMGTDTNRTAPASCTTASLPHENPGAAVTEDAHGPVALILMAACFGLGTGLLELVLLGCQWSYDHSTWLALAW